MILSDVIFFHVLIVLLFKILIFFPYFAMCYKCIFFDNCMTNQVMQLVYNNNNNNNNNLNGHTHQYI